MNIFIIHSGSDREIVSHHLNDLKKSSHFFNPLMLENGNIFWKFEAAQKIKSAQMVIFFAGEHSHESPNIGWELKCAKKAKKPIYTVLLNEDYSRHTALRYLDPFSGEERYYDHKKKLEEVKALVNNFEQGDYHIFNQPVDKLDTAVLLEQYKVFLQTSEDLVLRRQNVNNFYISINSALIAIFSALFTFDLTADVRFFLAVLFSVVGIALSVAWTKILVAYGNLNASKMKIISSIEKHLPASLYDAEWEALSDKLNKKRYVSFTDNEKRIPCIFIIIYSAILILLVGGMLREYFFL